MTAPLIGLLLVTVVEMSGVIWTRELTADLLQRAVASAARLDGSQTAANARFQADARAFGLDVDAISWKQRSLHGKRLLSGVALLRPGGITLLPNLQLRLDSEAVIE